MFAPFLVSGVPGSFAWFRGKVKSTDDRNGVVAVAFDNGMESKYRCPSPNSGEIFFKLSKEVLQRTTTPLNAITFPVPSSWRSLRERHIRKTLQTPSSSRHAQTVYNLKVLGMKAAARIDLGYSVASLKGFSSVIASGPKLSQSMKLEKWYFETTLLSDGQMRVGWIVKEAFEPLQSNVGVGDCIHSWGYDGSRQEVFHNRRRSKGGAPRRR